MPTKFLRWVNYATQKGGEEMKPKSKGNFRNFVEEASENKALQKKFLGNLKKLQKPEDLLKLFHSWHYYGVSHDDCNTILRTLKNPERLDELWKAKY